MSTTVEYQLQDFACEMEFDDAVKLDHMAKGTFNTTIHLHKMECTFLEAGP